MVVNRPLLSKELKIMLFQHIDWVKYMKYFVVILNLVFSLFCTEAAKTQTNSQWVECFGEATLQNISNEEGQAIAIRRARLDAIEKVCGVNMRAETMVKDFKLAGDFIHSISYGHVVEEKDIKWKTETLDSNDPNAPPTIIIRLSMNAKVVREEGRPDPYFSVNLKLNRSTFVAGDEVILNIKSTKDCYLTVLNLAANDSVYVLLPNKLQENTFVNANSQIEFPSENFRDSGLHLRVSNLPGHKKDNEIVFVIATKQKIDFYDDINISTGFGLMGTPKVASQKLARWLAQIPVEERAEASVMYAIHGD